MLDTDAHKESVCRMTTGTPYLWCAEDCAHVFFDTCNNRVGLGAGEPYETAFKTTGALYRACLKEHGRCVGTIRVGEWGPLGTGVGSRKVGWVFLKKAPDDMGGCIETCVTVYIIPPRRVVSWTTPEYPSFR